MGGGPSKEIIDLSFCVAHPDWPSETGNYANNTQIGSNGSVIDIPKRTQEINPIFRLQYINEELVSACHTTSCKPI
jgi:hypothetical protein